MQGLLQEPAMTRSGRVIASARAYLFEAQAAIGRCKKVEELSEYFKTLEQAQQDLLSLDLKLKLIQEKTK